MRFQLQRHKEGTKTFVAALGDAMGTEKTTFFAWLRDRDYSDLTCELYGTLAKSLAARGAVPGEREKTHQLIEGYAESSRPPLRAAWQLYSAWVTGQLPRYYSRQKWQRKRNRVELLDDDSAYLWATNRKGEEIQAIRVDQEDLPRLLKHRWSLSYRNKNNKKSRTRIYVITQESTIGKPKGSLRKTILLHRFLMNPAKGMEVDHIDGDSLDNRKAKMRVVTKAQQMENVRSGSKTGHRNVYLNRSGSWSVTVRRKYIGTFHVLGEAVRAAAVARSELLTHHNETREGNFLAAYDDSLDQVKKEPAEVKGNLQTFRGKEYPSLAALVRAEGEATESCVHNRLCRGWDMERALKTPTLRTGRPRKDLG